MAISPTGNHPPESAPYRGSAFNPPARLPTVESTLCVYTGQIRDESSEGVAKPLKSSPPYAHKLAKSGRIRRRVTLCARSARETHYL